MKLEVVYPSQQFYESGCRLNLLKNTANIESEIFLEFHNGGMSMVNGFLTTMLLQKGKA
jgi:hypothetical protein